MSIFSDAWGRLKLSTARGLTDAAASISLRYKRNADGELQYVVNRVYKSKLVQEASRIAIQAAMNEIKQLYPNFLKSQQAKTRKAIFDYQINNYKTLIQNQRVMADDGFGKIEDKDNKRNIYAVDKYGVLIPEALMLYYYDKNTTVAAEQYYTDTYLSNSVTLAKVQVDKGQKVVSKTSSFDTHYICHIDLAPEIQLSSSKNLILTQVQGRDYSRKELVSGGDLQFSVSGNIMSNQSGVYPSLAVGKFLKTMQYNGILTVHNFMFKELGVTRVLIKDFSLGPQEYKNIQPYSFSCVAVEPDEEIALKDTIQELNDQMAYGDDKESWTEIFTSEQFNQIVSNATTSLLNSSISTLTDLTSGKI